MANQFYHNEPHINVQNNTAVYDDEETDDEDWTLQRPATAFPFFHTSDPALRAAYSYGDPRGGSYPDPTMHQMRSSAPPDETLTTGTLAGLAGDIGNETEDFEDEGLDELLGQIPAEDPERDPDFGASDLEDEESADDLSAGETDSEDEAVGRQGSFKPNSTRGRGSRRRGRGGRATRGQFEDGPEKRPRRRRGEIGRRKGKYGPRAHAETTPKFKELNGKLTEAFLEKDWDKGLEYGFEAIKENPEVFSVHGTIAEILIRKGRVEDALGALFVGVQATREAAAWRYVVEKLIEYGADTKDTRQRLQECYSELISMDPEDYASRLGRMKNYHQAGQNIRARNECFNLLKRNPYDYEVLNHLSGCCFALGQPEAALPAYETFVTHCMENDLPEQSGLDWSFLDSYADMLIQMQRWDDAIKIITVASRWLLGRSEETFWDLEKDDREWDAENEPRRIEVPRFGAENHDVGTYGQGLLVELRAKLGFARLGKGSDHVKEALHHFEFLEPEDEAEDAYINEYPDLFREVGDALREAKLHQEALRFYEPLKNKLELMDSRFCFDLAICYQALGRDEDYKSSLQIFKRNARDPQYHIGLAKLYQSQGRVADMWHLIKQLRRVGKSKLVRDAGLPLVQPEELDIQATVQKTGEDVTSPAVYTPPQRDEDQEFSSAKRRYGEGRRLRKERIERDQQQDMIINSLWQDMKILDSAVDACDPDALAEWLGIANEVFEDFQGQQSFFPRDRHLKFIGYGRWRKILNLPDDEQFIPAGEEDGPTEDKDIPVHYRRIHFDEWLEWILLLAMRYAKNSNRESCWDVLNVAASANIFAHEQPRILLIRNISMTCALILQDNQRLVEEARWFMKWYPYVTETYRLFCAVNRFCRGDVSFFNSGPEQKFTLRAVKTMDFGLLPQEHRLNFLFTDGDRVKWSEPSSGRNNGNPHELVEHDPALLVLYGHMMFVAATYTSALTYYFRAYVLRPEDPILNLCIAISYVQMGFKRQTENRQFQIQQGLSFLQRYYNLRTRDNVAMHVQEAEFNMAVMWHSLGLLHLAVPKYERCLELSGRVRQEQQDVRNDSGDGGEMAYIEDFAADAAFGLQLIFSTGGDFRGARKITEKWLVL
ncbi:Tetratricopeptide-like helical [Venturia nashicola]|uniref:Tetratricopeptide-like helical n=1 Tax=Venturia nashicola TaxID=86259 RepID=A0A4Z1NHM4_9PEZI|nr:Tetratricopeptide-like helical [Venturia nashicola]